MTTAQMDKLKRPQALAKLEPPWTSQVAHLTPAEARAVWQYVAGLEMEVEHLSDLVTVLTAKEEEAT